MTLQKESLSDFIRRWCSAFDMFFPSGYFLVAVTLAGAGIAVVYGVPRLLFFLADKFPILGSIPW